MTIFNRIGAAVFLSLWFSLACLVQSCSFTGEGSRDVVEALRVGVKALEKSGQLTATSEYELRAERKTDGWVFTFYFLPQSPGRHSAVFVPFGGEPKVMLPGA